MGRKNVILVLIALLAVADLAGAAYLWTQWPQRSAALQQGAAINSVPSAVADQLTSQMQASERP